MNQKINARPVDDLLSLLHRMPDAPNLTWRENVTEHPTAVLHEIVDQHGRIYGSGLMSDDAVKMAKSLILSEMPVWLQTKDEFTQNSLKIPVRSVQGKSGEGTTGPKRLMVVNESCFQSESALHGLRLECQRLYERNKDVHTPDVDPEEWVSQSIQNLLSRPFEEQIYWLPFTGGRNLFFVKEAVAHLNVPDIMHRGQVEEALKEGKRVPAIVMQDYPELVQHLIDEALEEEDQLDESPAY